MLTDADRIAILESQPGDSPWHMRGQVPAIGRHDGLCSWAHEETYPWINNELAGVSILQSPAGEPLLILGFYVYVKPIGTHTFLTWAQEPDGTASEETGGAWHVRLFDAAALPVIPDPERGARQMNRARRRLHADALAMAQMQVSLEMPLGKSQVQVPPELQVLNEILMVGHSKRLPLSSPRQAIFCLRPLEGTLEIIPQNWFNEGDYDFGYQGIRIAARDPSTGRLMVRGTRIKDYLLDESGTRVEREISVH